MKSFLLAFFFLLTIGLVNAQRFVTNADTLNNKRLIGTSVGAGLLWGGTITGLSTVWYKDFPKTAFHLFDDCTDWGYMDKLGHLYTNYHLSESIHRAYTWSGLPTNQALWLGMGISFGYQGTIEILDGFSSGWGFSMCDLTANAVGAGLYGVQEWVFDEQRIRPKFSFSPSPYATIRPEILGKKYSEQWLKDYNGQTQWYSISLGKFLPNTAWPKWLALSFGYSVDQKLIGDLDFFVKNNQSYTANSQFLFSLDIDIDGLNIQREWVKLLLRPLNWIKIPFPTLQLQQGKFRFEPLYF